MEKPAHLNSELRRAAMGRLFFQPINIVLPWRTSFHFIFDLLVGNLKQIKKNSTLSGADGHHNGMQGRETPLRRLDAGLKFEDSGLA